MTEDFRRRKPSVKAVTAMPLVNKDTTKDYLNICKSFMLRGGNQFPGKFPL